MKIMEVYIIFLCMLVLIHGQGIDRHSTIYLSQWNYKFEATNLIELIDTIQTKSVVACASACNINNQCRTFDYDYTFHLCRLFEGAFSSGTLIPSISLSRVGYLQLSSDLFTNFAQSCSECLQSRYLICLNDTCQCPINTFWNGFLCENQRYSGASCNNDQYCRYNTLRLTCSNYNICTENNNPINSTSTTLSTTTITLTTTTLPNCNATCVSDPTVFSLSLIAQWSFENTFEDSLLSFNGTGVNNPTFVPGYVGKSLSLNSSLNQYVWSSYIPLNSRSFTIDGWIYPTGYPNINGSHSIVGMCPQQVPLQCLRMFLRSNIGRNSSIGVFSIGDSADLYGSIPIHLNQWTHIAIIYAKSKKKQIIYINGILDNSRTTLGDYNATNGTFFIGNNYNLTSDSSIGINYFQGYIDQLTITNGARPACELLNVATLAARFTFDNSSNLFDDSGPNHVTVNASDYQLVNGPRRGQAIALNGSLSSFMEISGFRFLSSDNSPISISLWIQPTILQGNLVSSSLGYSFLSFTSNGSLIAQIGSISFLYNHLLEMGPTWTHIVLTWSSINGLQLYIDNQHVGTISASTLIGSGFINNSFRLGGETFSGALDDFRIYSRELTSEDVCALFIL